MADAKSAPAKMGYKSLGKTGLQVSELCLGGMTLGNFHSFQLPVAGEAEGVRILNKFEELGGNFIDTANWIYGDSEEVIGRWLTTKTRDKFVIATKAGTGAQRGPNQGGLGRKHIKQQIDESLKRLGTSYVDLYQCHVFDPTTPLKETLHTMDELVRAGKVHYIGVSNFLPSQLQKAIDLTEFLDLAPITCLQPSYSLLTRGPEWDLFKVCIENGVGVIPWSPLGGGWLAGKFKRSQDKTQADGSRLAWMDKAGFSNLDDTPESVWRVVDEVEKIAKETGHTMSQVSLRWCMQKPGVTSPIVGTRSVAQLEDNFGAVGWSLTPEQMQRLDDASEKEEVYPYGDMFRKAKKKN